MRHDERYEKLDTLGDYELKDETQDIRGRPLVNSDGFTFGTIEDLLVSKDHERVEAVRLDNGLVCAVEPLTIHDNAVVYGEEAVKHAREAAAEREEARASEERVDPGERRYENGRDMYVITRGN